jgi:thymine-DNA glycosylase
MRSWQRRPRPAAIAAAAAALVLSLAAAAAAGVAFSTASTATMLRPRPASPSSLSPSSSRLSAPKRPRLSPGASASASASSSSSSSSSGGGGGGSKGGGGFLGELYSTVGRRERPLRVLFVGHNPSEAAWKAGHYFANPSNRFWHLLRETKMIPASFTCEDDSTLPHLCGYGFTDLGTGIPGTKSGEFKATVLHSWRASFYQRIKAHAERSGAPPRIVAFTGKRQFQELLFDYAKKPAVAFGMQSVRPKGWPFKPEETQLFVLTSPSGAAAMSNEARMAPYLELAQLVEAIPWEVEEE